MKLTLSVLALVAAVACGGSTASTSSSPASSSSASQAATGEKIAIATNSKYGQILVDGEGMTVYLFVKDKGTTSTCYGQCATFWPPVLTDGKPQAATGVDASLLGTTTRTDGKVEVTYAGHPLYYFLQDKAAGQTTGQGVNGFGDLWWVLNPTGAAITTK